MLTPSGLHHVTAIASDPQQNIDFYAGILGLRLVKRTVNFDDPTTYHFYFGDALGSPGTLLTFFPWPNARKGRQGAGQAAAVALAIPPSAVGYWLDRFLQHRVAFDQPITRFDGERVITFRDPDGLMLELVAHASIEPYSTQKSSNTHGFYTESAVPDEFAIRRLYSVTLWVEGHLKTAQLLTTQLGYRLAREQGSIYRYVAGDQEYGRESSLLDVRVVPGLWSGVMGAGTIHHIAFRADSDATQMQIHDLLAEQGYNITPQLDRDYFRSVYFREPGGVLLEIATDPPGFTVDEPADQLGRSLRLPLWLEARRFEIEALLPNIHLPIALPGPNA